MAKQKKRTFAVPAILAAGSLWGSMGLFVRVYNARGLQSMDIVAIRAIATVIAMFVFMIFFRRELLRIRLRDLWCFLGTGIGSIVFFNYCYFKTISLTSMSVAAVLLYTAPAIVMVLSRILFGERFTVRKVTALVMTFVGCIFVTGIIGDAVSLNAAGILSRTWFGPWIRTLFDLFQVCDRPGISFSDDLFLYLSGGGSDHASVYQRSGHLECDGQQRWHDRIFSGIRRDQHRASVHII